MPIRTADVLALPGVAVQHEAMGGIRRRSRDGADPVTLEVLLAASANGDRSAFAALFDRTAPRVHGTVIRVLRDPAQSEEVTQEVFFEVWRRAASFDPKRGSASPGW